LRKKLLLAYADQAIIRYTMVKCLLNFNLLKF